MNSEFAPFDPESLPLIECTPVDLPLPSLKDNTADLDRLLRTFEQKGYAPALISPAQMNTFARKMRKIGPGLLVVAGFTGFHWKILDILPQSSEPSLLGYAIDLGTTSLVLRLIDLTQRTIIREHAIRNPQISRGEDILSRILFAGNEAGLAELHRMLIQACTESMRGTLDDAGLSPGSVYALACAGNTAMSHFFWGLDPSNICKEPYIPTANTFPMACANDLGFDLFPNALLYLFPNVGSYVGGDIVSGILAAGLHRSDKPAMLVDVGTNAEVVLGSSEWLLACAGAAGPALEGGVVACGIQAAAGAIDRVRIDRKTLEPSWRIIGGGKPAGICGSGLIDLVAEMFASGILTVQGRFNLASGSNRFRDTPDGRAFALCLAPETRDGTELLISEIEIGVFLKSKAVMFTILSLISGKVGLKFDQIKKIYIAGNFGNRIDPEMAVRIGMIPDLPLDTFCGIGNSSLLGASLLLLDRSLLGEVERIRSMITYIELNVNLELMNEFRGALFLPHTDRRLFPSVRVPEI
ncbi:MAG: ASKHA domain-containing protein [Syntrophobacteraceae bacterium]